MFVKNVKVWLCACHSIFHWPCFHLSCIVQIDNILLSQEWNDNHKLEKMSAGTHVQENSLLMTWELKKVLHLRFSPVSEIEKISIKR